MDALELFTLRYDDVHVGFVDELFTDVADGDARRRPSGLNSIAWLVWHFTRVQDAVVSRLVTDEPQVLDEGDWNRAMGVDRRDVGTGMTGDEVDALSARVALDALRGYHRAVAERTRRVAGALTPAGWSDVVPAERVRHVVAADGLLVEAGAWVGDFWAGSRSRGWCLLQVGLLHPYGHCFDALITRGLLSADQR